MIFFIMDCLRYKCYCIDFRYCYFPELKELAINTLIYKEAKFFLSLNVFIKMRLYYRV